MDIDDLILCPICGNIPALSRSLSEMISEEIISLKGKKGKILNFKKLRKLIASS